jgi:urease accessory protein
MMHTRSSIGKWLVAAAVAVPTLAQAHAGLDGGLGIHYGFVHPFTGVDHLLAMIAVGLWAMQLGGRALWQVPASFVAAMTAGAALGTGGMSLPFMEQGIVGSVFALGVLVAAGARLPLAAGTGLVATFALFHGFAHGMEMPPEASGIAFFMGLLAASAALHFGGIGLAVMVHRVKSEAIRFAGAVIAGAGVLLALS